MLLRAHASKRKKVKVRTSLLFFCSSAAAAAAFSLAMRASSSLFLISYMVGITQTETRMCQGSTDLLSALVCVCLGFLSVKLLLLLRFIVSIKQSNNPGHGTKEKDIRSDARIRAVCVVYETKHTRVLFLLLLSVARAQLLLHPSTLFARLCL